MDVKQFLPTLEGATSWFRAHLVNRSPTTYLTWILVWIALVGTFDFVSGFTVRAAPLYLPAIFIAAWFLSFRSGFLICALTVLVWFTANYHAAMNLIGPWVPLWNMGVRFAAYFAFYGVVWMLRRERDFALSDPLTGVANRRAMHEYATRELARCRRLQSPITVAYLDYDNFKQVNDQWGHDTGDSLLRYLTRALRSHVRRTDLVARLGGGRIRIDAAANHGRECTSDSDQPKSVD